MADRPNVLLILADDLGFSDLGCYGGEIRTPNLDRLAGDGARLSRFYSTPRCSPSRAALMTGLHPHQTGVGILTSDDRPFGYRGSLGTDNVTIAEALRDAGYRTYLSGKWHLTGQTERPNEAWPTRRGFDRFFGTLVGCGSYYDPGSLTRDESPASDALEDPGFFYTDAITNQALAFLDEHRSGRPFFLYAAYTAPHWPLHALGKDIARYEGIYEKGWDAIRGRRLANQRALGLADDTWNLSPRDPDVPAWHDAPNKRWETARMRAYAAMVERMDRGIGRILTALESSGELDNTIVAFLSDNGGCAEPMPPRRGLSTACFLRRTDIVRPRTRDGRPVRVGNSPDIVPGPEDTYSSYGVAWANVSNTPFRLYKRWTHEGGIATPLIVRYPKGGIRRGAIIRTPYQITSVRGTLLELAGVADPHHSLGLAPEQSSPTMTAALWGTDPESAPLCWEHTGNAAIRAGSWKLVRTFGRPWELYDFDVDPVELNDVAPRHPDVVQDLDARWRQWADAVGVIPFERTVDGYVAQGRTEEDAGG